MSAAAYVSAERARLEAERLWPRAWLFGAHVSQLRAQGDFVSLSIAGDPIVVVRDHDRVRAFHDVCRHRGARITSSPQGRCDRLRCRYHGWEYATDGSLRAAPGAGPSQLTPTPALAAIGCAIRHGIAWIAIDPDRAGDLDEWLAPIDALLASSPCATAELHHALRTEVPCNWKVSSDVHNEGYHLPTLHPELAGAVDLGRIEVELLGRHTHFRIPLRIEGRERLKHQVYLFPNVQVNWTDGGDGVEIYRHWPHATDPERAYFEEWRLGALRPDRRSPHVETCQYGERSFGAVTDADLAMLPLLQEGLRSRAAPTLRPHRLEEPIAHMHRHIEQMLAVE